MDTIIINAVPIRDTYLCLITDAAKELANLECECPFLSSSCFIALAFGKPKIIIPAGRKTKENTIAIKTPNAVKMPKYLIG